jgi:hypothetical protein
MDAITKVIGRREDAPTGGGSGGGAREKLKTRCNNPITTSQKIKENIVAVIVGVVAVPLFLFFVTALLLASTFFAQRGMR